ncbi:helix-turn-helix domain-containing protein [Dactylosporangium sp. NPDC051541]|uniref:helix-turn-helix domain-containing protein n=1 Tax=Dactylosporangium sp. NPDC051541 TaxID=3363977 RepID=UPI0037BC8965
MPTDAFGSVRLPAEFWQRAEVRTALDHRDFGALFHLIAKRGYSQTRIGAAVGMTQSHISNIVRGQRRVTAQDVITRVAEGLTMPDHARHALGLAPTSATKDEVPSAVATTNTSGRAGGSSQSAGLPVDSVESDVPSEVMKRRSLISLATTAAAFGVASTAAGPIASLLSSETARHALLSASMDTDAGLDIDELDQIVLDYGVDYLVTSPAELRQRLTADILVVQLGTAQAGTAAQRERLRRIGAVLATFMAKTTSNLGDLAGARRWWRAASQVADRSGDPATVLWVRGQEIIRALYDRRDINDILRLVDRTEPIAAKSEMSALPSFMSGKAQAFAAASMAKEARTVLEQLDGIYSKLPTEMTAVRDRESDLQWPHTKYLFTASYVHARCGSLADAYNAQEEALREYLPSHVRAVAQINLHRALCMVTAGDPVGGLQYAQQTMSKLPSSHHVRPVIDGAHTVLASASEHQRAQAACAEFANYLTAQAATEA